ncbi:MAG: methyltransferase [Bacteroidetes bacterium HGW-Bacteroidetes-1]|jgi:predicted O-methyltransferase YrrM|nr:MAG: methyltransferase [Bacteroidetes bacterium HGW-Bacteroidetes-1]
MNEQLSQYLDRHSTPPSEVLKELYRQTYLRTVYPRMASGPLQGKFLEFITHMIKPDKILEIGTFTGYSAISLCAGLSKTGTVTSIENNEELEPLIRQFFFKSGLMDRIDLIIGDAKEIIPTLNEEYDLIFLDAGKDAYPLYYPMLIKKLKLGGFLLADNVLWGMKVLDEKANDSETLGIQTFNRMVAEDVNVEQVMLPLRDGLFLIRKIAE